MRCCASRAKKHSNDLTWAGNCLTLNKYDLYTATGGNERVAIDESEPVSEHLLAANGLSHQDLFSILGQLTERRLDYGDLYFQSSYHESRVLEDSIIKDGSYNIDGGVGVRAVSGEKPVLPMQTR